MYICAVLSAYGFQPAKSFTTPMRTVLFASAPGAASIPATANADAATRDRADFRNHFRVMTISPFGFGSLSLPMFPATVTGTGHAS